MKYGTIDKFLTENGKGIANCGTFETAHRLAEMLNGAEEENYAKREWVNCPVCGESDMRKESDEDDNALIFCVNHNCASNGGDNMDAIPPRADALQELRAKGWMVAVHNDYRQDGERYTFWLMTKGERAIKGEGRTDEEALAALARAASQPATTPRP